MNGFETSFKMNAYLFGCIILMFFWTLSLIFLKFKRLDKDVREFWWASISCFLLGFSEPLFVPEYWDPPSILKFYRWDFESFIFCFAVGGVASVIVELPWVRKIVRTIVYETGYYIWRFLRAIALIFGSQFLKDPVTKAPSSIFRNKTDWNEKRLLRFENMLLITFFLAIFGTTSHFKLNIIYDAAIVCVATAFFIWWRRPELKWQIFGGGIAFTIIYTLVLIIVGFYDPKFYDHWNHCALSGKWFAGAPVEEYLFSFTFGAFWAPLYEAWKNEI
ncbi:MAG: hypothetical protein GY839_14900 [candidate division Zixibacteria bacterium]|nr:hypothetical protein [candidate division Zixibacteria bacterium]